MSARAGGFAALVREGRHGEAIEAGLAAVIAAAGGELSVAREIGGLRLVLQRVIVVDGLDGDVYRTAETVAGLVEAIVAAARTERLTRGAAADDLAAAVDTILGELGLGE